MPKKFGIVFVTLGAVLIMSALLLFMYNRYEDFTAGQKAELLLDDIQSVIAENVQSTSAQTKGEKDSDKSAEQPMVPESLPAEMPEAMIDGYDYIGYLTIPDLEMDLPVMADWDYDRLNIAPCRHFGSSRTDDLVIAAHNYISHFGSLSKMKAGSEIYFTDMDGIKNHYRLVSEPEVFAANAVDEVKNSGYDLVLYTCTPGGLTRVVAFFDRVPEATK